MHVLHGTSLDLPAWALTEIQTGGRFADDGVRMRLAVDLARRNVAEGSGGPFGAAVFDAASGELVSIGVNRVVPLTTSIAHAEMMALLLAQRRLGVPRLDATGGHFVLATSAQPCSMCFGACAWAGISTLLVGARREDVESLTDFREGPLPEDWIAALAAHGIEVRMDILREEACAVLRDYHGGGGPGY